MPLKPPPAQSRFRRHGVEGKTGDAAATERMLQFQKHHAIRKMEVEEARSPRRDLHAENGVRRAAQFNERLQSLADSKEMNELNVVNERAALMATTSFSPPAWALRHGSPPGPTAVITITAKRHLKVTRVKIEEDRVRRLLKEEVMLYSHVRSEKSVPSAFTIANQRLHARYLVFCVRLFFFFFVRRLPSN